MLGERVCVSFSFLLERPSLFSQNCPPGHCALTLTTRPSPQYRYQPLGSQAPGTNIMNYDPDQERQLTTHSEALFTLVLILGCSDSEAMESQPGLLKVRVSRLADTNRFNGCRACPQDSVCAPSSPAPPREDLLKQSQLLRLEFKLRSQTQGGGEGHGLGSQGRGFSGEGTRRVHKAQESNH